MPKTFIEQCVEEFRKHERSNDRPIYDSQIDFLTSKLSQQSDKIKEVLTEDLEHDTYCRIKGEQYKECALCYIKKKLSSLQEAGIITK